MAQTEAAQLYHFFVGGTRHETDKPFLTGAEIKALGGVNPAYELFFRDDVNTPDRLVRDTQAVDLIPQKEEDGSADSASFGRRGAGAGRRAPLSRAFLRGAELER